MKASAPAGLPEYADDVNRRRMLWMQAARGKRFCRIFPTEAERLAYAAERLEYAAETRRR